MTGRGVTYNAGDFAAFEVPERFNLAQFTLEIRALRTHRVGMSITSKYAIVISSIEIARPS